MLNEAIHYVDLGFSVIPVHSIIDGACSCGSPNCNAPGKHPRLKWKGTTDKALPKEEIKKWWTTYPDSNVGIVTGKISGITVIDVDGEEGLKSLEEAGLPLEELPITPTVKTGGGGIHLIYRYPERIKIKTGVGILPKVDIRSDGGFVVAPPSMHYSGHQYEWVKGRSIDDLDPADFDFSLLVEEKEIKKPRAGDKWYEICLRGVSEGERDVVAAKLAGRYFSMGMSILEVTLLLESWNLLNTPPMSTDQLLKIIRSIRDRESDQADHGLGGYQEAVSSILKLELNSVQRITGDEPQFILNFDEGSCTVTTGQLLSPKLFQLAVAEATKIVIKRQSSSSSPTHDKLAQMIMNCAEDVDAGLEATGAGELTILLKDYLSTQRSMFHVEDQDIPKHGCFYKDGLAWVNLMDLVQRSGAKWGIKTSMRQMAQRLKGMGIERKVFKLDDGSSRIMWGVHPDVACPEIKEKDSDEDK